MLQGLMTYLLIGLGRWFGRHIILLLMQLLCLTAGLIYRKSAHGAARITFGLKRKAIRTWRFFMSYNFLCQNCLRSLGSLLIGLSSTPSLRGHYCKKCSSRIL